MSNIAVARTVAKLTVIVVAMFAFVFVVMVPLYDTLCAALGLNGKYLSGRAEVVETTVDESRTIKVQFVASNAEGMPWEFQPVQTTVQVHPGAVGTIVYHAHNGTDRDMIAQAVPSFVPARAARYVHKTECFCFQHQPLKAGESAELPMQFIIDQDLPREIRTISVSYTIFDITDMVDGETVASR
ncbi:MAG: cytochrome c oxidase assembly protein [Spongiibacteraceae bacterium]|jgi:cytochrome c oxidase assembly protein subunit 11|nr:cytochrome c oxidase assembly protein [Spongiibacteraceae bacterium]